MPTEDKIFSAGMHAFKAARVGKLFVVNMLFLG
jgi:hypothetical protein